MFDDDNVQWKRWIAITQSGPWDRLRSRQEAFSHLFSEPWKEPEISMLDDYDQSLDVLLKRMRHSTWGLFNYREWVGRAERFFDEFEAGSFDELPPEWLLGTSSRGKAKQGSGFWLHWSAMSFGEEPSGGRGDSQGSSRRSVGEPDEVREPLVEIVDREDGLRVVLEIPRATKEEIEVTMDGRLLSVSAGGYHRTLELPESVKKNGAKATFRNGILEILFPKDPQRGHGVRLSVD